MAASVIGCVISMEIVAVTLLVLVVTLLIIQHCHIHQLPLWSLQQLLSYLLQLFLQARSLSYLMNISFLSYLGSCLSLNLNYSGCCDYSQTSTCSNNGCYCDQSCHSFGDCCSDIASIGCHPFGITSITSLITSLTLSTSPISAVFASRFTTTMSHTPTSSLVTSTVITTSISTVVASKFITIMSYIPTSSLVTSLTMSTPITTVAASKLTTTMSHTPTSSPVTSTAITTPIPTVTAGKFTIL